jgi:hypothetical protein
VTGEGLRYDALVEDALRGVVRRALTYAAERGLPGDHHFYVTFNTKHPGVDIPAQLHKRYPKEMTIVMTIVLQYQFWGLDVGEEAFGVTLSFADVPERLTIPFAAITAFADPSVQFGLQFDPGQGKAAAVKSQAAKPTRTGTKETEDAKLEKPGPAGDKPERSRGSSIPKTPRPSPRKEPESEPVSDKIVQLDIFRKK